jgi:hypothetical protein
VIGPDGRRELDVLIEGTTDGNPRTGLVECKDFNPHTTGPVGIAYIDALDSKRRDLNTDFAMLFSNAGFTADAIRKAKRVDISLASVMKKGDPRLRFSVIDEIYSRKLKVNNISMTPNSDEPIDISKIPFSELMWQGVPVASWVLNRIALVVAANPIVTCEIAATHQFLEPLTFTWPDSTATFKSLTISFSLTGDWFSHQTLIDSTTGLYDWLRRRVRLAPGPWKLGYHGANLQEGTLVNRPEDREFLRQEFLHGEIDLKFLILEGLEYPQPVPDLNTKIAPKDLELTIENIPYEATISTKNKKGNRVK